MPPENVPERWGRETRLLVLVVLVSLAVLFLLARFRFPSATLSVSAPSPLGALASRATFDDLATSMHTLVTRVSPRMLAVTVTAEEDEAAQGRGTGRNGRGQVVPPPAPRIVPALRMRTDLALVYVPAGFVPSAFARDDAPPLEIVARDERRELALVRVGALMDLRGDLPASGLTGFEYVGGVGATAGGMTVHPAFIARVDAAADGRWPLPVMSVGPATGLRPGAFVFAVDGRFLGLAVPYADDTVVLPPGVLDLVVSEMLRTAGGAP